MEDIEDVEVHHLGDGKFLKPFRLNYTQDKVKKTWELLSVHQSVIIIIYNTDRKKLVLVKQFRPAMYFSNYPREVRELAGCGSPTTSQQFTQTQPQPSQTQETQTQPLAHPAPAHTEGSKGSISSKATQSSNTESSSKATQSDASACCSEGSGAEQTSQESKKLHAFPGSTGVSFEFCAGIVDKEVPLEEVARQEVLEECGYSVPREALQRIISLRSSVGSSGDVQTMFYTEVTDAMRVSQGGGLASEGEHIEVVEWSEAEARQYLQQEAVMSPGGFLFGLMWFLQHKLPKEAS